MCQKDQVVVVGLGLKNRTQHYKIQHKNLFTKNVEFFSYTLIKFLRGALPLTINTCTDKK